MKGIKHIKVSNKRISYEFELKQKITIINGDSATGKTTLIRLIDDAINHCGVKLECEHPCKVLTNSLWELILKDTHESIVFIEDFNEFKSDLFAEIVKNSSNYYVFICRDSIPSIYYSYKDIYEIHTSGKFHTLRPRYKTEDEAIDTGIRVNKIDEIPDEIAEANYIYQMAKKIYKI